MESSVTFLSTFTVGYHGILADGELQELYLSISLVFFNAGSTIAKFDCELVNVWPLSLQYHLGMTNVIHNVDFVTSEKN